MWVTVFVLRNEGSIEGVFKTKVGALKSAVSAMQDRQDPKSVLECLGDPQHF